MTVVRKWNPTPLYIAALLVASVVPCSLPLGAQLCFEAPESYPAGEGRASVITADFNEDGHIDLAVANLGDWDNGCNCHVGSDLSVLLGDGLGGFAAPVSHGTGDAPISFAAADFNEDGHIDLAVAMLSSDEVVLLLGDGLGGFATPVSHAAGETPVWVETGDFNEDGHIDLAVTNNTPGVFPAEISLLLGDGLGAFGAPVTYVAGTHPSAGTTDLIAADLNGDGHLDLTVANYWNDEVSILLGDGLGGFSSPVSHMAGDRPLSVTSADFDEDGDVDLAVANQGTGDISVLLGDGLGGFAAAVSYPIGVIPYSVIAADLNEDGHVDLAVAKHDYFGDVTVFVGDGLGGFGIPVSHESVHWPTSVTSADFNEDGHLDLAVGSGSSSGTVVFRTYECDCNGNGTWDPFDTGSGASEDCNMNITPDECEVTTDDCNANGIWDECEIVSGAAVDCNGNGIPDECDIASPWSDDINGNGIPDECDPGAFVRGDCYATSVIDIGDPVWLLIFLFSTGPGIPPPSCLDACDANDDGALNIADAVAMFTSVMASPALPLPGPYPGCGLDPLVPDGLDCVEYLPCP